MYVSSLLADPNEQLPMNEWLFHTRKGKPGQYPFLSPPPSEEGFIVSLEYLCIFVSTVKSLLYVVRRERRKIRLSEWNA